MNICIRVDSSTVIGTGHVVRCLTLAEEFLAKGHSITFICRELPGNIVDQIQSARFEVHKLPMANYGNINFDEGDNHRLWLAVDWTVDARQTKDILRSLGKPVDLLIVDHYALDINWEKEVKDFYRNLMVIDDLADRQHRCDFILDQNLYTNYESRYNKLVPESASKMLGPSYALLRPEFYQTRERLRLRDGIVQNVLIFFGGSDASNQTQKVLETIAPMKLENIHFDIVIGNTYLFKDEIENLCNDLKNIQLHCQIDYMAELMVQSDLCVGGGGTTTWERCCLGLPSLTIAVAENQVKVAKLSDKFGFARYLGFHTDVDRLSIRRELDYLLKNPNDLINMSRAGLELVDGKGAIRVTKNIMNGINENSGIRI